MAETVADTMAEPIPPREKGTAAEGKTLLNDDDDDEDDETIMAAPEAAAWKQSPTSVLWGGNLFVLFCIVKAFSYFGIIDFDD